MKILNLFILALIFSFCQAGKHRYSGNLETDENGYIKSELQKVGMFSPDDTPSKSPPGNGVSYVKLDFEFSNSDSNGSTIVVHTLLLNHLDANRLGVEGHICSNDELIFQQNGSSSWLFSTPVSETGSLHEKAFITKSGSYSLLMFSCLKANIQFEGKSEFMNPYGFLPGELWGSIPFYGIMMFFYLVTGIVWLIKCIRYYGQILPLQKYIGGIIFLGFLEMSIWLFDNLGYNGTGKAFVGAMSTGVILSGIKRMLSRVLVLVVSLGYGVVKPTLGQNKRNVIILGLAYFVFSVIQRMVELSERDSKIPIAIIFLDFPVALLDTIFYWWIYFALLQTMRFLQTRKQIIKFEMYKNLFSLLVGAGVASAIIMLPQIIILGSKKKDQTWKSNWLWDSFWQLLYFVILVGISYIWRPTSNNTRYAYQEINLGEEEFSINPIIASFSDVTLRKIEDGAPKEDINPERAHEETEEEEMKRLGKMD